MLLFANTSQAHPVASKITEFNVTGTPPSPTNITIDGWAILDLTAAYAPSAGVSSYRRGFISLSGTAGCVVVDELEYNGRARPANVTWQLHTARNTTQVSETEVVFDTAARLSMLPSVCAGYVGLSFTNLSSVLPSPPFDSAKGLTRIDAIIRDPASPTSPCSALAFAMGDAGIVDLLLRGSPVVLPMQQWATRGPLSW